MIAGEKLKPMQFVYVGSDGRVRQSIAANEISPKRLSEQQQQEQVDDDYERADALCDKED
jgi:hypothetical protein